MILTPEVPSRTRSHGSAQVRSAGRWAGFYNNRVRLVTASPPYYIPPMSLVVSLTELRPQSRCIFTVSAARMRRDAATSWRSCACVRACMRACMRACGRNDESVWVLLPEWSERPGDVTLANSGMAPNVLPSHAQLSDARGSHLDFTPRLPEEPRQRPNA